MSLWKRKEIQAVSWEIIFPCFFSEILYIHSNYLPLFIFMPENDIKEEIPTTLPVEETTNISEATEQPLENTKSKFSETIDFFRDLIIIFVVVIFVRTFIAAPFQ